MPPRPDSRFRLAIAAACFAMSGAAGLTYEVVWNHTLVRLMGNTAYALSALLAVFMGGLALGAWLGGRWAPAGGPALRAYALVELGTALSCLALPVLLHASEPLFGVIYRAFLGSPGVMALFQLAAAGVLLLVPTTLMGASLPLLVRFAASADATVGRWIGRLYGLNALGAGAGALLAGFVLLPRHGATAAYGAAVATNAVVGAVCLVVSRGDVAERRTSARAAAPSSPPVPRARLLVAAFALCGFASMAFEVAWTRAITLSTGSYGYAFSLITAAFVVGLALGSLAVGGLGDGRRAALARGFLPLGVGLGAIWSVPLLGGLPVRVTRIVAAAGSFEELETACFAAIFLVVLPGTLCMGALMPLVARRLAGTAERAGRGIGDAYGANTLGAILGAFAGGFLLIPALGVRGTILAGAVGNGLAGAVFVQDALAGRWGRRAWAAAACVPALLAVAAVATPSWDPRVMASGPFVNAALYEGDSDRAIRERMRAPELLFHHEGVAGLVTVTRRRGVLQLSVGGKPEAADRGTVQRWLGHLPMLLHPQATKALVIGLGSGETLATVLAHRGVEHVDCVEISEGVVEAARRFFRGVNRDVLEDPRVELIEGDGRLHLEHGRRRYDVIVSQPANPWLAGASGLFTEEAFAAMRRCLRPGGLACVWFQGFSMPVTGFRSMCATWAAVWPHGSIWHGGTNGDYLFVGSKDELSVDFEKLAEAMSVAPVAASLRGIGMPTPAHVLGYLMTADAGLRRVAGEAPSNTDDLPHIAYRTPLGMWRDHTVEIFAALHSVRVNPWTYVRARDPKDPAYVSNRRLGEEIFACQFDLYRALTLTGPDAHARAVRILEDVLRRNPLDPIARRGLWVLGGR